MEIYNVTVKILSRLPLSRKSLDKTQRLKESPDNGTNKRTRVPDKRYETATVLEGYPPLRVHQAHYNQASGLAEAPSVSLGARHFGENETTLETLEGGHEKTGC